MWNPDPLAGQHQQPRSSQASALGLSSNKLMDFWDCSARNPLEARIKEWALCCPHILSCWTPPDESCNFLSLVPRRQSLKSRVQRQPSERIIDHVNAGLNAADRAGLRMKTSALHSGCHFRKLLRKSASCTHRPAEATCRPVLFSDPPAEHVQLCLWGQWQFTHTERFRLPRLILPDGKGMGEDNLQLAGDRVCPSSCTPLGLPPLNTHISEWVSEQMLILFMF